MKKLFVPIVALATMCLFTNCQKDETAPEITIPGDALTIDLGDATAALKGVTAKDDKDGDVTSSLKVTAGLDYVGVGTLTYSVEDKAGNVATKTRPVTIKPDKLFGQYVLTQTDTSGSSSYPVIVDKDPDVSTVNVLVTNIYNNTTKWIFAGDGKTMELKPIKTYMLDEGTGDAGTVTTSLKYAIIDGKYRIFSGTYSIDWEQSLDESYTLTFK